MHRLQPMKTYRIILIVILHTILSLRTWAETDSTLSDTKIVTHPGRLIELKTNPGEILKNSNTSVIQIKDLGSRVILFAKKKGLAQIHLGQKHYQVIVTEPRTDELYHELKPLIDLFMGLNLDIKNQKILIRGELYRWSDWLKIATTVQAKSERIFFEAQVNPSARKTIETELNQIIESHHLPPVSWVWHPQVKAQIPDTQNKLLTTFQIALQPFGIQVETRIDQLTVEPSIEVEVLIAEISSRMDQKLGLRWGQEGQFTLLPQDEFKTSLQATLDALENKGLGKVLATPKLLCRSGHKAEFHSGGEFPINVVTPGGQQFALQNVIWKKHGMILEFEPHADRLGRLQIKIMAELSMLTDFESGDGIPGLIVNRIQSSFDLERPQTIALSGLIREDWHRGHQALPLLHQIPLLGNLFKSRNFINKKSELVVFVTPRWAKEPAKPQLPPSWSNNDF